MKRFFIILVLLFPHKDFAQSNSDINRSFLLHFVAENILIIKDKNGIKDYNLNNIKIEVDSIDSYYYGNIGFYRFVLGKNTIKFDERKFNVEFSSSSCDEYILAFDFFNGKSFRLKGFNGNDLFYLINDIKLSFSEKIKVRNLLSELSNLHIGINFKKLYKALKDLDFEDPLLQQCPDGLKAH